MSSPLDGPNLLSSRSFRLSLILRQCCVFFPGVNLCKNNKNHNTAEYDHPSQNICPLFEGWKTLLDRTCAAMARPRAFPFRQRRRHRIVLRSSVPCCFAPPGAVLPPIKVTLHGWSNFVAINFPVAMMLAISPIPMKLSTLIPDLLDPGKALSVS